MLRGINISITSGIAVMHKIKLLSLLKRLTLGKKSRMKKR